MNWWHEDRRRFGDALALVEAETGFDARLVEKDYYCSLVLGDLAGPFERGLVFKGGTCLSKVHAEFFRLSEDLDFAIPLRPDASRSDRRKAIEPFRAHLDMLTSRLPYFGLVDPLEGHSGSKQYAGRLGYRSQVSGREDHIKLDVSLREEPILPTGMLPARTLLRDPYTGRPALAPLDVRVLCLEETYAEKVRAALTRREPAIRDFFDIDHAVEAARFDQRDRPFLDLVAAKLAIEGGGSVDLSSGKVAELRAQLDSQLRPVLRAKDYEAFDLSRVVGFLEDVIRLHRTG